MHRIWIEHPAPAVGELFEIDDDEAHHALRVKRLRDGEHVELLDGAGTVVSAIVEQPDHARSGPRSRAGALRVRVAAVRTELSVLPHLEICSAVPKGDRLGVMLDQLCQLGVQSWTPMSCDHSAAEARAEKSERLWRIVRESCKQCGRAWAMTLAPPAAFEDCLRPDRPTRVFMADAGGPALDAVIGPHELSEELPLRVLIGPEGGWSARERDLADESGVRAVRLGPHIMRIETAALAAAAALLSGATVKSV